MRRRYDFPRLLVMLLPGLLVALLLVHASSWAAEAGGTDQGNGALNVQAGAGGPIEITADGALEWQRDAHAYVARDHARAVREGFTVMADVLIAYYREEGGGAPEIYRLDARGHVRLISADATVTGEQAIYDVAQQVAVVSGGDLALTTATDKITAKRSLEFWQARNLAVARGDAVARRADNELRSEVLMARFAKDDAGEMAMRLVDATGGVVIQTPTELVRGTQGRYDVHTEIATLSGAVKLTRGTTQLSGDRAEVNMATGVSRLYASGKHGQGQVRGVVTPNDVAEQQQTTGAAGKQGKP